MNIQQEPPGQSQINNSSHKQADFAVETNYLLPTGIKLAVGSPSINYWWAMAAPSKSVFFFFFYLFEKSVIQSGALAHTTVCSLCEGRQTFVSSFNSNMV